MKCQFIFLANSNSSQIFYSMYLPLLLLLHLPLLYPLYQFPKMEWNVIKGLHWASKFTIIPVIWTILECTSDSVQLTLLGELSLFSCSIQQSPNIAGEKCQEFKRHFPQRLFQVNCVFFFLRVCELTHSWLSKLEEGQRSAFIDKRIYFGCNKHKQRSNFVPHEWSAILIVILKV